MTQPRIEMIKLTRGDSYGATFTFDQPVSGFSEMRFTMRESWATTEIDNTTATMSVLLVGSGAATADLAITYTQTGALALDAYVYDVQVVTIAGKRYTTQRGQVVIGPDVSR
jgi:hypothetical protein